MKLIKRLGTNKFFLLIILIGLLFAFSALDGNSFFRFGQERGETNEEVLSEESEKETNKKKEEDNNSEITKKPTSTPEPTEAPLTPANTPVPENNDNGSLDSFIYPNGSIDSNNGSTAVINSSDSPDQITNWYEDRIEEHNMNTTSVVRTNTNGEVLNKMAASNGELSIEIEISSSNNDSNTEITVKIL